MASIYNWQTNRYEDEKGNEVSWTEVQKEFKMGKYSASQSVLITQKFLPNGEVDRDKKELANDYGKGFLKSMFDAAEKTNGNINIIQAADANDAANQVEALSFMINHLIIASHGTVSERDNAFFKYVQMTLRILRSKEVRL